MRAGRRIRKVPVFLLAMMLTSVFHAGHSVWSFNIPHQAYIISLIPGICPNLIGLSAEQIKICFEKREQIVNVGTGAKMAIKECQFQFQYRRWNCSMPDKDKGAFLERITRQSTREAALTYAISSAGAMWALAKACAEGNLSTAVCGCSSEARPADLAKEFMWGGCGDNLIYAEKFTKKFTDAAEESMPSSGKRAKDAKTLAKLHAKILMNLHNNKIGRMVVVEKSVIECKCHGVSGSCSLKTCWRQVSAFREVGNTLHDKYDAAIHVELGRELGRKLLLPKRKRRAYKRQLPSTKSELVFLESSPNFCFRDPKHGTLGTRGRKCIKDAPGTEGCKLLCCDKGYNTRIDLEEKRCKCKFYWCCQVRCKVCKANVTVHTCN
ncbi:protein Wnt-5b-like isoform X2 [Actinia tenebrosa]|nr:protein Wnt-5b-like isoform X2 [Actinia tenebrosa]XP_031572238.1 protein Wnt-5b-like isoform X2 [Actinia tenebrosa]XP_031572239.1 protein Wnt-5b-like isoform X2 [Actinia tenebrosa]